MPNCQKSKWAETMNFLLLSLSHASPEPRVAFPLQGRGRRWGLGGVVSEQEEMQSRKQAKGKTYASGAEELFQTMLSPQFILPNNVAVQTTEPGSECEDPILGPLMLLSRQAPAPCQDSDSVITLV